MSILVYKQRFKNPNYKSTASKNYAHICYIATRPRVAQNEGMDHGLFGKLMAGDVTEFTDWQDIARLAYQNSKNHITMYRSVISFDEATAKELGLADQKSWQRYIDSHVLTIAQKNGIGVEHLQWACALHKEKGHPHIHVVFWDMSLRIKNPFTPSAIPNAIRRQMIKDTFPDKIRAYGEKKNFAAAEIRRLGDELVDGFEQYVRQLEGIKHKHIRKIYGTGNESSNLFEFEAQMLKETAGRVVKIKSALPKHGRIAYQLLPFETKKQVDTLVEYLLNNTPELKTQKEAYVQSKLNMTMLYGGSESHIISMKDKFSVEADKIIANRILGMVKTLNRLDGEVRSVEYWHSHHQFYAEQMLLESLSMLSWLTNTHNQEIWDGCLKTGEGLSKEAKKELYLKYQDRGYEH